MTGFKNCILIVLFNYSNCVCNKDIIQTIYEKHFKQIIFYSDYPIIENKTEINFMNIKKGFIGHKIFNHFYKKYKSLIEESDGIFYTMDDNIINVNILNLFDSKKIIYYSENTENNFWHRIDYIDNHSGWWWDILEKGLHGKIAIKKLLKDNIHCIKEHNITKFGGAFSDWFFLPKKYLTDKLFELFDIFSKYEVFLEISIPTIINHIEKDKSQYQRFRDEVLWNENRKLVLHKEFIYSCFNHRHSLILHPVKFNENPDSKKWLKEIFCKDNCVIITTINKPTETIMKHITFSKSQGYDVIIVGDVKTPDDYRYLPCIFLDIESQKMLFPELCELLPYNHYCRKNLGYLYAIKRGYKLIYETDDDNIPYDNFGNILNYTNLQMITEKNTPWINIFKYFTNNAHIWPRGFPLSLLKIAPNFSFEKTDKSPSIINGLVENDPDVDALFRIVCNHQDSIQWDKNKSILIDNRNICVFNTQNTFWINPELFICSLIPSSVSFRYCDILRGIIANIVLKKTDNYMMYSSPNVIQNRNEHNLISDFKSEYEMYIHNEDILEFIEQNTENITCVKELLFVIYNNLSLRGVIDKKDIDILRVWNTYF